ncbi:RTA1-domain-containing protein [Cubamyces sp. BRFM 1775]|nr:RTA1-domain-containing protein [Cubamyces sp. BRFM 1775]
MSSGNSTTTGIQTNLYGYTPTRSVCYIFVILYSVSTLIHLWQSTRSKAWWLLPTVVLAGIAEVIGWGARAKSSYDPDARMPYIIQTSILVLAPTPFVAALFIGFGRISERLGSEYSRLKPKLYSRIFLTGDILSLMIQGGGGGIAASALTDQSKVALGSHVILVGLIVQIFSMTVFCYMMAEYAWRRFTDRPFRKPEIASYVEAAVPMSARTMDRSMKLLIIGICVSTALIYIRSVYRIIEFSDGYNGAIAHTQVLFNVFDGMMVTLAMYTLNAMHPGMLLRATAGVSTYAMADRSLASFDRRTSHTMEVREPYRQK